METMKECRFCNIFNKKYTYPEIDKPLLKNEKYAMVCSIGKEHDFSMRKHYNEHDFFCFFYDVKKLINKTYNNTKLIAFEHGANRMNSKTACGTCHAHLHVVPFNDSLITDLVGNLSWRKCKFSEVEKIAGNMEYLLYAEISDKIEDSCCIIHILEQEISQYFRKILANHINYTEDYSYKINPQIENTKLYVQRYKEELL